MNRFVLLIFLLLSFQHLVFGQTLSSDTIVVLAINGIPVVKSEYELIENKCKSEVIQKIKQEQKINFDQNFWTRKDFNPSPAQVLKQETLKALVKIKTEQNLAKKNGLISDFSYLGLLDNLKQENERRLIAIKNNQVIYGPRNYSLENYYDYVISNLIIKLKNYLEQKKFKLSDTDLKLIYERNKSEFRFKDKFKIVRISIINKDFKRLKGEKSQRIKKIADTILNQIKTNSFDATSFKNNQIEIRIDTLSDKPSDFVALEGEKPAELSLLAQEIKMENGIKQVELENGNFEIYHIVQQTAGKLKSFESVKNAIKSRELSRMYENYISELASEAIIVQY